MANIHVVKSVEPNPRTDITAALEAEFARRHHKTTQRTHDDAQYQPAGSGVQGEDYVHTPDLVVIDATTDMEDALRTAKTYRTYASRIIMLTVANPSPMYLSRCVEAGVTMPVPVTNSTPVMAEIVAGFATNLLAASTATQQDAANATSDGNRVWFDGGSLDIRRGILYGPDGTANLSNNQSMMLEALLTRPGQTLSKAQLHSLSECGEDTELKIVDVHICRIRKALTAVGLNGGKEEEDMIGTVWGRGIVFNPNATRPKETPGEGATVLTLTPGQSAAA